MGKPSTPKAYYSPLNKIGDERQPGEPKHPSNPRKRKKIDSLSSGERKGNSLNHPNVKASGRCSGEVVGSGYLKLLLKYRVKNDTDI